MGGGDLEGRSGSFSSFGLFWRATKRSSTLSGKKCIPRENPGYVYEL